MLAARTSDTSSLASCSPDCFEIPWAKDVVLRKAIATAKHVEPNIFWPKTAPHADDAQFTQVCADGGVNALRFEAREPDIFSVPRNLQDLLNRTLLVISFFNTGPFYAGPNWKGRQRVCIGGRSVSPPELFFKDVARLSIS